MEGWPKPGVPVRLVVKTWSGKVEHNGLALPSSGPKLITMKLQNGYNVSFPESYIDSFEVLEDMPPIEEDFAIIMLAAQHLEAWHSLFASKESRNIPNLEDVLSYL